MHVSKSNPASFKLIISVYLLLILFISLLVVITSDGGTTVLTTGDIDKMLQKKWSEKNLKPSGKSSDEDFIRRVYLDVTGRTPTADEVKSFLDDESGDKRKKKIDELLASPEYGEFAADIWMQILFQYGGKRRVPPQTYTLVKDEFAANFNNNKPYTEFVSKLVSSEGFVSTNPYALFAGRFETPEDAAGSTMKIFMGKQIQCAQCHKHPYEKISQEDFYGVASFFTRKQVLPLLQKDQADKITKAIVRMEKLIEQARDMEMENSGNQEMNEEMMNSEEHKNVKKNKKKQDKSQNKQKKKKYNIPPQWAIDSLKNRSMNPTFKPDVLVWDAINGQLTYEVKGEKKTAYPKFLGGASVSNEPGVDRRKLLAENMTTNETKQLSLAFVNRFWKHFFGYGFVNPVDDFTANDPGSNPELLNVLADEFMRSNFDIKNLFRLIANTEAYQLSSTPNSTNNDDHEYFSRAVLRPLSPIQLANSIISASGYLESKAVKNKTDEEIDKIKFRILQLFVYTFEDDEMNESENFSGTITQALLMMNSDLAEKVTEKKPGNFIQRLIASDLDSDEKITMIYLNTVARYPTDKELEKLTKRASEKADLYEDIQWALLNSSEFIFNH